MVSFRFIHTADIHLDSPLWGLRGDDPEILERIRDATRAAFSRLVDMAIQHEVAFFLIAGDLWDGEWRDIRTGLFFIRQMARLDEAGIKVALILGNHDAESTITKTLQLPGHVKLFSQSQPETCQDDISKVAIHGQSFAERAVTKNLAVDYPAPVAGYFNIGLLHTCLSGQEGHENYAPCSLDELKAKGYHYWALGHIHQRNILSEDPYVVYPGNIQGRHRREIGSKGAYLVTVRDCQIENTEFLALDVVRWLDIQVDISRAKEIEDCRDLIRQALTATIQGQQGEPLFACRVSLVGASEISHEIIFHQPFFEDAARMIAAEQVGGDIWIEKVKVSVTPMETQEPLPDDDPVWNLLSMIGTAYEDEALLESIKSTVGKLASALPHEIRNNMEDPMLDAACREDYRKLLEEAKSHLRSTLAVREG